MKPHALLDKRQQAIAAYRVEPGGVYAQAQERSAYSAPPEPVLLNLGIAHPDVLTNFAAAHSSENTASTSELLGAVKTLCAIAKAFRSRSYVIAAAVTSESGRLSQSISSTLASNGVFSAAFVFMGVLEVVEITWEPNP